MDKTRGHERARLRFARHTFIHTCIDNHLFPHLLGTGSNYKVQSSEMQNMVQSVADESNIIQDGGSVYL